MQPRMAGVGYWLAIFNRVVISAGAIGSARRRVVRRYSQRLADAVVAFDSSYDRTFPAESAKRYACLFGKRLLKTQPHCERVIRGSFVSLRFGFINDLFAQIRWEALDGLLPPHPVVEPQR